MRVPETTTILTDGKIMLCPIQQAGVGEVFAAARESIAQIGPWMPWCHANYSIEETQAWIELQAAEWTAGKEFAFAILDATTGAVIGSCGLNHFQDLHLYCNLGYWVRTSRARQGMASAATLLLARWGFEELGLQRIEIVVAVGNVASLRVAQKAGAVREGVQRNRLRGKDGPQDAVMFSLIPATG